MKVVSLFCGAGGLDLGLQLAGLEIIWSNDNFDDAVSTYSKNIGNHVDARDINHVESKDIPDCDVVVGGFPCQGFSHANTGRHIDDSRNQLYTQMVRVIKDKKPKFFIAENVKGIVSLGKGEVLKTIIKDFSEVGYNTYWKVLNSADYGVPQKRMRFVMLGIRKDLGEVEPFFPPHPSHSDPKNSMESNLHPWVTAGDALKHLPDPDTENDVLNHKYSKYKLRFNGYIGHRFIDPNKPAPTVTGRGDAKGGVVVLHHPNNERRMSARELAAIQSFPDSYEFMGNNSSAYRQIANAVPPLLGKAIGEMLMENQKLFEGLLEAAE